VPAGVRVLGLQRVDQHLHAIDERLLVEAVEVPHPALEMLLVKPILQNQISLLQRLLNPGLHFVNQHRLRDVIECPHLEALDGCAHLGDPGQHDDGHVGIELERLTEERHAVHLGHVDIGDTDWDFTVAP